MNKNIKRFVGEYPKIGIRPVIDGREQGVRESLEKQTRDMALSLKNLLEKKLRYPDGTVVECIVFDGTIGGVYEASQCQDVFRRENVSVSITVTPSWCYGTEVMDMDPLSIKAVWGFNGTERPGAVYLAAALAGYNQMGLPAFSIYGRDVQEASDNTIPSDVEEKLIRFAKAGVAASWLRGKSYLSLGSTSMGIAGSCVDPKFFQKYLGMRNEYVDMTEIKRRIDKNIFDQEEFERAYEWTKKHCKEGKDVNPEARQRTSQEKDEIWKFVIKMTIIIRDLMNGNPKLKAMGYGEEALGRNALISGFQGQRHWTDHYPNGDFSEAILNSSFDWNGIREPFLVATENDSLNGVAMSFGHLLTGSAQMFSDVRTYWSPEAVKKATGWELDAKTKQGFIHLINSGSSCLDASGQQTDSAGQPTMKAYKDISSEEVVKCLNATSWHSAVDEYFRGGGYSSHFVSKEGMKLTMARVNLIDGLGPVLQIAEGYSIELPDEVHKILDERTDETWPTTWFVPNLTGHGAFTDVYSVMANWGANHGAISFGHIGADLITMASMLRIPVCMHNVSEDKIFRPSVWGSFGGDSYSQDFNACKNFGSLYGK